MGLSCSEVYFGSQKTLSQLGQGLALRVER